MLKAICFCSPKNNDGICKTLKPISCDMYIVYFNHIVAKYMLMELNIIVWFEYLDLLLQVFSTIILPISPPMNYNQLVCK